MDNQFVVFQLSQGEYAIDIMGVNDRLIILLEFSKMLSTTMEGRSKQVS